jgi:spore coat polysaccharide biosynthesis protein SpsF
LVLRQPRPNDKLENRIMRIVAFVEARMRSTRLPGKVLKPILGRPMLALQIERLKRARRLNDIVIATVVDRSCDPIEELACCLGVGCYRGSEEDVLIRVLEAARHSKADLIVEINGDNPLIDPGTIDRVVEAFLDNEADYCSNCLEHTYPDGMAVQVFPLSVLEEVAQLTDDPVDHEHVSLYIYEHPEKFRLLNVRSNLPSEAAKLRLTVDTPEDFELVRRVYEELYPSTPDFGLQDILDLFRRKAELCEINSHIKQKRVR